MKTGADSATSNAVCFLQATRECTLVAVVFGNSYDTIREETRLFGPEPKETLRLKGWLQEEGVSRVAFRKAGGFWKPVIRALEDGFHIEALSPSDTTAYVRGSTSDEAALRLARALSRGNLQGRAIPPLCIRQVEDLDRYRKFIALERRRILHRIHGVLQDADVRLSSVMASVSGSSGLAILRAIAGGESDAGRLVALTRGRLNQKRPRLRDVLAHPIGHHQRWLLGTMLAHLKALDDVRDQIQNQIVEATKLLGHPPTP